MVETIATVLHNYLQQTDNAHYTPAGFVDCDDKSGATIEGQYRKFIDKYVPYAIIIKKGKTTH